MSQIYIPKRRILLPQVLDDRLKELTELQEETNGALLFTSETREDGLDCHVDALYMTNVGTARHVAADPQRMEIINRFFQNNSEYRFIKWHTHSRGTGEYWFNRLSQGDIDSYKEQLKHDPEFIGMMVSPIKKIIVARGSGEKNTSLQIVPTPSDFDERQHYVDREIEKATRELGYTNLPRLKATRRG